MDVLALISESTSALIIQDATHNISHSNTMVNNSFAYGLRGKDFLCTIKTTQIIKMELSMLKIANKQPDELYSGSPLLVLLLLLLPPFLILFLILGGGMLVLVQNIFPPHRQVNV